MILTKILFFFFLLDVNISNSIEEFNFKVSDIHTLIRSKRLNCTGIIDYFLERSYHYGPKFNAIINYNSKSLKEAIELDDYFFKNNRLAGKLHCIPVLVKDNIDVEGMPTTCGVKALRNLIPNKDATIISKLRSEGAIVIAKANLVEFAGSIYNSELGGGCRNPWDITKTCGGSSSGTGAGIAAGLAVIGIGTDTAGSIMTPSGYCGLYGLRPPINTISVDAVFPASERHDTVGPMTRYIEDLILVYEILANNEQQLKVIEKSTKIRLGYFKNFFEEYNISSQIGEFTYKLDSEVYEETMESINRFKKLEKFEIVEINLNATVFSKMVRLIENTIASGYGQCIPLCYKYAIDKYFADSQRYESDAPYHRFDDLASSPLLSDAQKLNFNLTNLPGDVESICEYSCKLHDEQRMEFTDMLEIYYKSFDIQAMMLPTNIMLPNDLDSTEFILNLSPIYLAPITGFSSLTIPIGFSKATKMSVDGLPIALMLLSKQEDMESVFEAARLYDDKYLRVKKLPPLAPLLNREFLCEKNESMKLKLNFFFFACFYSVKFLIKL